MPRTVLRQAFQDLPASAILVNSPDDTVHSKGVFTERAVNEAIAPLKGGRTVMAPIHDRRRFKDNLKRASIFLHAENCAKTETAAVIRNAIN